LGLLTATEVDALADRCGLLFPSPEAILISRGVSIGPGSVI